MTDPRPTHASADQVREAAAPEVEQRPDPADERSASEFATHGDPTEDRSQSEANPGRPGVQWGRPTDIAARAGSVIIDRGADLNIRLRDAVLEGVREGRAHLQDRLIRRQAEMDPESTPTTTRQRSLGREGVGR